jgi:FXSXX-COOH protein
MGHETDGGVPEPLAGLVPDDDGLIDVSRLSLREVFASEDTAFGHVVRRLLQDLQRPSDISSAFSSFA